LSDQEEKLIVKLLLTCSDMGFCLTSEQTLDVVENYVNESGQGDLFKNTRPSEDWYYDFVKRHDELTIRNSTNLPANRAEAADGEAFNAWFERIEKIYDENNFHEKPCHIFNCDEIGMICDQGICR
jgi:hypothetical protein